jgi:hypothetical protein
MAAIITNAQVSKVRVPDTPAPQVPAATCEGLKRSLHLALLDTKSAEKCRRKLIKSDESDAQTAPTAPTAETVPIEVLAPFVATVLGGLKKGERMTLKQAQMAALQLKQASDKDDARVAELESDESDGETQTDADKAEYAILSAVRGPQEGGMAIGRRMNQGPDRPQAAENAYKGICFTDGVFTLGDTTVSVKNHDERGPSVPLLSKLNITGTQDYDTLNRVIGSPVFLRWLLAKQAEESKIQIFDALLKLTDEELSNAVTAMPVYSTSGEYYAYLDVYIATKTFANQGLQVEKLTSMLSELTQFLIDAYFQWDAINPESLTFHETPCYVAPVQRLSLAEWRAKRAAERAERAERAKSAASADA